MPDGTTAATPKPTPGADVSKQMQEMMLRLMKSATQPRTSVQPPEGAERPNPSAGQQGHQPQQFVHGLFGMIQQGVQAEKQKQLRHATGVLQSLNNSWEKAQELAQGDQQKATQLFSQMPEVTHIFEDKKNVKQLGKLLQFDFMEPEKKKTVWHEALGKVVEAGKQLPIIKALSGLMKKHKDSQQDKQPTDYAAKEQDASTMASRFAGQARQDPSQQAEQAKMMPSLISSVGADIREKEKEVHSEHMLQMRNEFAKSIDSIKNPVDKAIARGMQFADQGNQAEAQKYFDMAHRGSEAKSTKTPSMTLNAIIHRMLHDPDPQARKDAQEDYAKIVETTDRQLLNRGQAFGMSRLFNWVNDESGETAPMNGFEVQQAIKSGEKWSMISPLPPDKVLSMQQIVRSMNMPDSGGKTLKQNLESDIKAFDNSSDRAIISRVLRANPAVASMDESSLGVWIDQNLSGQLSNDGKALMQDIKQLGEVFIRSRALTGQTSSEMNTMLLLGLLPNEKTPNSTYGKQQLEKAYNYLDGMVQAPILGGGKFAGGRAAPKKAATKKSDPLGILD